MQPRGQGGEGKAHPKIWARHGVLPEEARRDHLLIQPYQSKARTRHLDNHQHITRASRPIWDGRKPGQVPIGKASTTVEPEGREHFGSWMEQMVNTSGRITNPYLADYEKHKKEGRGFYKMHENNI